MLELLHIENIAVIEEADIQFRPGFNALTGETGAGKSIVIPAGSFTRWSCLMSREMVAWVQRSPRAWSRVSSCS